MRLLKEYLSTKVEITRGFPKKFDIKEIGHYCELNGLNEYTVDQVISIDVYPVAMYITNNTPYSTFHKLEKLLYCDYPVDTFSFKAIMITYEKEEKSNGIIKPACHFITYDHKTNEINVVSYNSRVIFEDKKLHVGYGLNSAIKVKTEKIEDFEKFRDTINDAI